MPSAGSLVYLLVGLNSLIQSSTIHVEALLSLCVGQFSHVLSLPVCRCYSFTEPLQNCFSCNLLLPVGHSKNPEKRSLRFRTPVWPERYNWACSVGWPDLEHTYEGCGSEASQFPESHSANLDLSGLEPILVESDSSSGGELEAGELVIDDSYREIKKKKKSKKSKKIFKAAAWWRRRWWLREAAWRGQRLGPGVEAEVVGGDPVGI